MFFRFLTEKVIYKKKIKGSLYYFIHTAIFVFYRSSELRHVKSLLNTKQGIILRVTNCHKTSRNIIKKNRL